MKCIFYEKTNGVIAGKIIGRIKALAVENKTELYHSIKKLSLRLTSPVEEQSVAILIAADRGDLLSILPMQKLLGDIQVIIILPDRDDESVSLGYKMKPCFLTYRNGDFSEVHGILKKLILPAKSNRTNIKAVMKNINSKHSLQFSTD